MPTTETAPVGAPCWIDLGTSDPDKSRAFYTELFGWGIDDPGPDYGGYVNFTLDGAGVGGCMKNPGEGPDGWTVYLASADAEKTAAAVTANGGTVVMPPMAVATLGSMALVADPGGAVVGLWQPGDHKGFGVRNEPNSAGWFELHTAAYDAVVAFYEKAFGFDAQVASNEPDFRYTTYGSGENQRAGIMDAAAWGGGAPAGWSIYFRVEDTDKTVARAQELGATVVSPAEDTPYGRLAHLTDPTGAHFKLMA